MSGASVLVVEDDAAVRTVIVQALGRRGHDVTAVGTLADLWRQLARAVPAAIISDVVLPDGDGLQALTEIGVRHPGLPVIILSAQNTLTTAVRANAGGAFDYLPKPFDLDDLARAVDGALARRAHRDEAAGEGVDEDTLPLIGRSPAMQDVYRVIARVVGNDLTVLVTGESGTGKELVARAIHDLGRRRAAPFVAINMAAIPRELIEAELFGHERGAFTGAAQRVSGRFEQAAGGTLFLDEIGDMPMEAQTRLLRVLQSGEFTTVGGSRPIRADVRIVAATNRDLAVLVADGSFREDLFYRLNVVPVALPPLRARRDDIGALARHFLDRAAQEGLARKRLDTAAVDALARHDWPGNVRELENLMRRAAAMERDDVLGAGTIAWLLRGTPPGAGDAAGDPADQVAAAVRLWSARALDGADRVPLHDALFALAETALFEVVLGHCGGNQLHAARLLGINRNTLRKRMGELGVSARRERTGG